MKKILFSIFIALLGISCSEDDRIGNYDDSQTEIKLMARFLDVTTKAPIDGNSSSDFSIGVYATDGTWKSGQNTNLINNDSATIIAASSGVAFNRGPYFYPSNGDLVTFYAFAPFAKETVSAGAGTSPQVTHRITGKEDVMWGIASGRKMGSDNIINPELTFAHKLTQLRFTFKADLTYILSNRVVSVMVKSQPSSVVMDVGTGSCTFSGSSDMQALSVADQAAGISITLEGTNALSPVMTKAQSGNSAYLLDVVVKNLLGGYVTYPNIPVNVNAVAGGVHMITLTFTLLPKLPILGSPVVQSQTLTTL